MRRKKRQGLWIVVNILILVSYHILYRMKLRLLASAGILGQVEFFSGKAREGAEEARV